MPANDRRIWKTLNREPYIPRWQTPEHYTCFPEIQVNDTMMADLARIGARAQIRELQCNLLLCRQPFFVQVWTRCYVR